MTKPISALPKRQNCGSRTGSVCGLCLAAIKRPSLHLATGSTVFNGAHVGTKAEVRINGVVHIKTKLAAGSTVPIGWVAVGDPAQIFSPNEHDHIWAIQEPLDFPRTVFGLERAAEGETIMPELTTRYARALGKHREDKVHDS